MNQKTDKKSSEVATSVQSIVIQPCPFCGSEAKRFRNAGKFWFVACNNAFCKMRPESTAYYKVQKAIDDWNQRSNAELMEFVVACQEFRHAMENYGHPDKSYRRIYAALERFEAKEYENKSG